MLRKNKSIFMYVGLKIYAAIFSLIYANSTYIYIHFKWHENDETLNMYAIHLFYLFIPSRTFSHHMAN